MWDLAHLFLAAIVLYLCYLYYKKHYEYWDIKGVKVVKPVYPLIGSTMDILLNRVSFGEFFKTNYEKYKNEPLVGLYSGSIKTLMVNDPVLIKDVMVKDFDHFMNRGILHNKDVDPLSDNVLLMEGVRWKIIRKNLTPSLTSGKLKAMYPLIEACAQDFEEHIRKMEQGGMSYELKSLAEDFTTTVIGSVAFGVETHAMKDRNCIFRRVGNTVFDPSFSNFWKNGLAAVSPTLFTFLGVKLFSHCEPFFMNLFKDVIRSRELSSSSRNDFIDTCLELKNKKVFKDDKNQEVILEVTDELLCAQAFFFFLAGFETSATTFSFALYELAMNPDIQRTLFDEIQGLSVKYENRITPEYLQEAKFLDKVLDETLRKYPPIGIHNRVCNEKYMFGPEGKHLVVDMGTQITIPVFALHRDPKYYPDPERFNPERFSAEEINKRPQCVYMPFGEGPRICLGIRFAKLQIKMGIISVVRKFEILKSNRTPEKVALLPGTIITKTKGGLWVKFLERKKV